MGILLLKKRVYRDKCSSATKQAYVWGLRYQWDPSLSRKLLPRFPHFMPLCLWIKIFAKFATTWYLWCHFIYCGLCRRPGRSSPPLYWQTIIYHRPTLVSAKVFWFVKSNVFFQSSMGDLATGCFMSCSIIEQQS